MNDLASQLYRNTRNRKLQYNYYVNFLYICYGKYLDFVMWAWQRGSIEKELPNADFLVSIWGMLLI